MTTIRRYASRRPAHLVLAFLAAIILVAGRGSGHLGLLQAQANPIPAENLLAGTPQTEWDVFGTGSAAIQGFATDISVNVGETVGFKVDVNPATPFHLDIYRIGYYQANGARRVATLENIPGAAQAGCGTDGTTGLVDCGNWTVSASWLVPANAVSGVYIAKAVRDGTHDLGETEGASHIVFLVRDDSRPADVLLQTSDTTWQAYNRYGGASLYCGGPQANAGAYAQSCPGRATKVSYNRPVDTRDHSPQSFFFNADYPMIRFLEANGYNVKYWSGVDTDRRGADLVGGVKPKTFISVGHDEYWSGTQRTHVENARGAGVNLAFFSGNEVYWKTRWENSIAGPATAYRTLVTYKDTINGVKLDPMPNVTTGTWRDTRFGPPNDGGRPENALIGTIWTVNNGTTAITVPASMKDMRLWNNTRIENLTSGEEVLAAGSLGYEWGEDLDNGFRPAGVIHLSSTTVNNVEKIIDFGANVGMGNATHHLTLYRHGNALVFGASTVQWAWGLDREHDDNQFGPHSHTPDQAMQQATVNLLADMGAQPSTLRTGDGLFSASQSSDSVPPTSTITSPTTGTFESGSPVVITGTANDGQGQVAGVEVSVDGGATWHPAQGRTAWTYNWVPGTPGPVAIRTRAVDDSGNLETPGGGVSVTVVTCIYPCTSLWRPTQVPTNVDSGDGTTIEVGVRFKSDVAGFVKGVRFYKAPANFNSSVPHTGSLWSATGALLANATFTGETASGWQEVSFDTPYPILANTTYVASYFAPSGHYSYDSYYFDNRVVDSPPLHSLPGDGNATTGGNGLYFVGGPGFPTSSYHATNYWVDVVFALTLNDAIPPVISSIKATTIDSSKVAVSWVTNEDTKWRLDYGTDPNIVTNEIPPPGTLSVTNNTFATQHKVTLTGLQPNTTYYYKITATDRSGNSTVATPPTFTVPGPTLRDTASPDFAAGTGAGTYVSETGDGEVILMPSVGSEFSGPTLPAGWVAVPWNPSGLAKIEDGVLVVDGARVATCATDINGACVPGETTTFTPSAVFSSPHSLEFSARFSGSSYQHAGFGVTFSTTAEPWAIFSVMPAGNGVELFARTNLNAGAASGMTSLGTSLLGSFHRYRIDWNASSVDYYVDGALVASHAMTVAGPMRPVAASDFDEFGGTVFVDWMRMSPNSTPGVFVSRVFDAMSAVDWKSIQWAAKTPAGTTLAISVRTGDTPVPPQTPDGTWTAFVPVASAGPLSLHSRYIQYRLDMTTNDSNKTAELEDIIISTGSAPLAMPDFAALPKNTTHTFPPSGLGSLTYNDTDADVNDTLSVAAVTAPSHGTAVVNADGSVAYTPVANYFGPDTFTYTVTDGLLTSSALVTLDVRFANVPPVSNNDFYAVNEDATLTVPAPGILFNDTDVENNPLTALLVSFPAHGMLTFQANGAFTYTPALNYAGPDSFTYKAHDGLDGSAIAATVNIMVNQVNDPPYTVADSFNAMLNQPLDVAAPGVLANDRDVEVEDTAPLHAQLVSPPAHGQLTFNTNGSFSYIPDADFLGSDSFTYSAVDHFNAVGAPTSVTLTVAIKSVTQSVASGTVSTGTGVSVGDPLNTAVTTSQPAVVKIAQGVIADSTSPTGFTFLNQQVNITLTDPTTGLEVTATAANPLVFTFEIDLSLIPPGQTAQTFQVFRNGVVVPDCPGATTIPAGMDPCVSARSNGTKVKLTILTTHASHWNMGLGTLTENLFAFNDPTYVTNYQTSLEVATNNGVSMNDVGPGHLVVALAPTPAPYGGTVTLNPSGAFDFMPNAGFCGVATFTYELRTDSPGVTAVPAVDTAVATIKVNCLPIASPDAATVNEDSGPTMIDVRFNDTDPDQPVSPKLAITAVTQGANGTVVIGGSVTTPPGGAWVSYQPNPNFFGSDTFTYTIKDISGDTATGTVTMTVSPVNDVPSFLKGADQTAAEDAALQTVSGWATALDVGAPNETQSLTFTATSGNPGLFMNLPAVAPDGTLTYRPAANANGSSTVTVYVKDNGGTANGGIDTSATQMFNITVTAVNDAPVANDQTVNASEDTAKPITLTGSDIDSTMLSFSVVQAPLHGTLSGSAPNLSYLPAINYNGADSFTFKVNDGALDSAANATVSIVVGAVNDPPAATAQSVTTNEDVAKAITLAGTDVDSPLASLTFSVVASPMHGGLTGTPPNVTYTPAPNYNGADSFTFKANDGSLDSTPAVVSINVTPVNDAPVATGQSISTSEDTDSAAFTLAATDIDSASMTYSIVLGPAHGTLIGSAPNLTYRPAANYNGGDSFTFKANDGSLDSNIATVTVTVTPVNDPPAASAGSVTTNEDTAASAMLAATDIDANALTYSIVANGGKGVAAITNASTGAFTYTPNANANGSDTFTFKANDGTVDSSVATMSVTINPVNDAPAASNGSLTTNEDTVANGTLGASDVDGNTLSYSIVANGGKGSASITNAATGAFTYTPNANANGSDTFTFMVNDGTVNSNTATISVTITPVNDAPSASNGTLTTNEDAAANGTLSATDVDGNTTLTYSVVTNGTKGTAVVTNPATGAYTYTPALNAYGTDTFTFKANDGTLNSPNATVTVTINGINDPPSFTKGPDQTIYGLAGLQSIAPWATNLSVGPGETGQTLTFTVTNNNNALFTTQPAVAANGTLTYAPSNVLGTAIVTVVLKDNAGGSDTSPAQTFNITVNKSATTTAVSSSSNPTLFGVPLVLTATVTPIAPGIGVPGGSVTFKRGTTTIGSAGLVGNVATLTTATLPVGTHSITAVYGGNTNYNTSTSAAMSQVIESSGKLAVTFTMFEIKDGGKFPRIGTAPVAGALVRVYTRKDVCTNGVVVSMSPKMWGKIFDGLDGPGGTDPGCPVVTTGTYRSEGVTAANGTVTITVPPTANNPNEDYVVIGRTEGHDYFGWSLDPDTIYAAAMVRNIKANETKKVGLFQLRLFSGKKIPGNVTEEFGSYLAIVQPEFMEFTDNQEQYPFVMVAEEGDWNVTTSVTPPEGFIPDLPALEVSAPNGTITAMQFTVTDIASEWTETTVNHNIKHLGETRLRTEKVSMFDKKATLAKPDSRKVMHDSGETIVDVMTNDRFAHTNGPISITSSTPALNGNAVLNPDGYFGYTPNPGFTGTDTFTYTITDAVGTSSTATVTMTVLSLPEVSVNAATRIEGNSGQSTMTVNVKLSNQSLETVTVDYQTVNDTATAGADYVAQSGSLTFAPLTTTMPVTVQVIGDTLAEAHEKFFVRVSNPTNAQIAANPDGVATITDDDVPEISIAPTASMTEGNTGVDNVAINVTLSQSHEESVWVSYATSPVTAQPGSDYIHTTGTLQFLPGMTTRTIYVPVIFDTVGEANETLYVDLNTPLNATLTSATKATVTIIDNDSTNWVTSTVADFGAGTLDAGAYLTATNNGEVMLRPAMADEFFGPSVPAGWTTTALETGGMTGIASGQLIVDGAAFQGPGTGVAGRTLEFAATFSGIDQSIGFGSTTAPVAPLAMFVIKPNNELYAISINGTGARWEESPMAGINWRDQKLNFKIVWNAGSVQYYIGTTLMITHSNMAYGTVALTPEVIDGHAGGVAATVDWMRLTPYAAAGTYTSAVFDAGAAVTWQKLTASASVVSGTTLTHTYRTGNTPDPEDGTWTSFTAVGAQGVIAGSSQYIQFRSTGTSANAAKTPILNDVTVAYKR